MHPDRAEAQPCERCGTFGCGECLRFVGAQKQCPACRARLSVLEWDQRSELGMFRAWWLTTKRIVMSPLQTFDSISPDASLVDSMLYALLSTMAGLLPTLAFAGMLAAVGIAAGEKSMGVPAGLGIGLGVIALYLVVFTAMSIALVLGLAAAELVILKLAGVTTASYAVAVRVHALSTAAYLGGVIPVCSLYFYPVWAVVLRIFAIQRLQKTSTGAAIASALIPVGFCCLLCGGFYALAIAASTLPK